jgi:hypothetical protein
LTRRRDDGIVVNLREHEDGGQTPATDGIGVAEICDLSRRASVQHVHRRRVRSEQSGQTQLGTHLALCYERGRMSDVNEQLVRVEHRLDGLEQSVSGLRGEVGGLRLVAEDHTTSLTTLCEAAAHNTARLDEIVIALRPLQEMRDLLVRVADNHERRIQDLEKHAGIDRS